LRLEQDLRRRLRRGERHQHRLGAREGALDVGLRGAAVDVEHDARRAEPRAQVPDQVRLAAAALAHQHHRDAARDARVDREHLEQRVARQAVAAAQQRRRGVAAPLDARQR